MCGEFMQERDQFVILTFGMCVVDATSLVIVGL
jgi:hypothetical protein